MSHIFMNNHRNMGSLNKKCFSNESFTFSKSDIDGQFKLNSLKLCNTIIPQYLIFNLKSNISINDFINCLEMSNFKLLFGNNIIVNNLLSLYSNLNPLKIIKNTIIITIPYNMTFGSIYLLKLQYDEVLIELNISNCINSIIDNVQLACELTYLNENNYRFDMASSPYEIFIQEFETLIVKLDTSHKEIKQTLEFEASSKGLFIECNNISNISNIKLKLNCKEKFNYNSLMLQLYTVIISPNLLYIPFDSNIKYNDISLDHFSPESSCTLINVKADIEISLFVPIDKINIHSLCSNILRYSCGKCNKYYAYENT